MAIKDYSTEPDMNTTISGINIAEGCAPSGINNAIRQLMADIKEECEAQGSDIEALRALIAQEVAKCLPLIGGAMSGPITGSVDRAMKSPNSSGRLLFLGGTSTSDGAYLGLYGADNGNVGRAVLSAVKGNAITALTVKTDGAVSINNNDILTSAGGTMTGALYKERGDLLVGLRDDAYYGIYGCTDYGKGARIILSGKDCEGWNGELQLQACDGVNYGTLRIMPNGRVSMNENPVLTLVASWNDGAGNWYRKYSDGLVMQRIVRPDTTGAITINLHTPMTDNTYFVVPSFENATGGEISVSELTISSKTRQSFVHNKMFADRGTVSYIVIGY